MNSNKYRKMNLLEKMKYIGQLHNKRETYKHQKDKNMKKLKLLILNQ